MSAGAVKVAIVHKAIRGRRAGGRANQKAAAIDPSQRETKRATMSGTLSTSASSLGSEPAEESILDSSGNPVRKRPDQRRAADESPDRRSSNGDQSRCAGKALASDAAAGKARNPKRVRNIFQRRCVRRHFANAFIRLHTFSTCVCFCHFICMHICDVFLVYSCFTSDGFFSRNVLTNQKNENYGTMFTYLKTSDAIFNNTLLMSSV